MSIFHTFLISSLICLSSAHHVKVYWDSSISKLQISGIKVGSGGVQTLSLLPSDNDHFEITYDGTHNRGTSTGKQREFLLEQKQSVLYFSKKEGKKRHFTLQEFADMIANNKVNYKPASSGEDGKYSQLIPAEINWEAVKDHVKLDWIWTKPELKKAFYVVIKSQFVEEMPACLKQINIMQDLTDPVKQKSAMTAIYNEFVKEGVELQINVAATLREQFDAASKGGTWLNDKGAYVGTGANRKGIWSDLRIEINTMMKGGPWKTFLGTDGFKTWVLESGEYVLRYNEDFEGYTAGMLISFHYVRDMYCICKYIFSCRSENGCE